MRVEYRLRFRDYLRFTLIHQFLSARLQAIFVLLCAFIYWSEAQQNSGSESFLTAITYYVAMWVLQIPIVGAYLFTRRSDGSLTDHVIELREDALYEWTKFNESRFFWPGILRVVRRPGYIAVYIAQHMAHVIPIRAFASGKQADEFVAYVRERMRAA